MDSVLYMPDGNRRFAQKHNIPLKEAYKQGGKTLELFSEFFVGERRVHQLIYHAMSHYTHKRIDSSLKSIYNAIIETLDKLLKNGFFIKKGILFRAIDHHGKLPSKLKKIIKELSDSTNNAKNGKVVVLLGYSLEEDMNQALSRNSKNYKALRKNLLFPDIQLVIRPGEMRPSGRPVYAMAQAQMITLDKLNPEITREDLEKIWEKYTELKIYREKNNPYHG